MRALVLVVGFLTATEAAALIFASPDLEPDAPYPADFPYWENVMQRRFGGPTVIYLGSGAVLTARHVGMGEIVMGDEVFKPDRLTRHLLLNEDGSGADAVVFRLGPKNDPPPLPIVPIATEPPRAGEDVLLIGFGRERGKVVEWDDEGRTRFGFEWSDGGRKRWGTNRVSHIREQTNQAGSRTEAFRFDFDVPRAAAVTPFEAQAAVGDSGGAVFVKRDDEWLLVGMMILVSTESARPNNTTTYGDVTFAADLAYYRSEILRWARPVCANEIDDDGDAKIDFPLDPGCASYGDSDERDASSTPAEIWKTRALAGVGLVGGLVGGLALNAMFRRRREAR